MLDRSIHFYLSLSFLPKCLSSSMFVLHKLGFSVITLFNSFSKFLKMVLLSPLWNWIKTGDYWTLKKLFNKLFSNILDRQCPFFHWKFLSFLSFDPLYHVCCSNHSVWFIYFLKAKRHFNLLLCDCANVSSCVCRYVSLYFCLYCQHLTISASYISQYVF